MKIAESFKEIEIYINSICLKGNLRLVEDGKNQRGDRRVEDLPANLAS